MPGRTLRDTGEAPVEEWLIVQHPHASHDRYEYWLCNLPADTDPCELAELARMRWMRGGPPWGGPRCMTWIDAHESDSVAARRVY